MAENLKKPIEELSLERLKRVAKELKKTGVNPVGGQRGAVEAQREQTSNGVKESRKENLKKNEKTPNPEMSIIERPALQKGEMKIAETALSDLIQERMELEKVLQEINNLKSKICQRIGLIKTIERRGKELNQQLASARNKNDFSDQIKKRLENLKENIHPVK